MKNDKKWIEVMVKIPPSLLEIVSNQIFTLGADGLEESDAGIRIYFPDEKWHTGTRERLVEIFNSHDEDFGDPEIIAVELPYQDWTESWKDNFKLFHLSDNIIIKPDWDSYEAKEGEIVVNIKPKMAFGTGHHETTQLVMILLEKYMQPGLRLLDAGTGSGILSILALKMGAGEILAFDMDPVAIENAEENFALNGIENKFQTFCGNIDDLEISKFDIIVANIDRNVLLQLPDKFIRFLNPGGILILSGLLSRDEDRILNMYEISGWRPLEKSQKGGWIALVLTYD